jgi:amino acid transporter
MILPMIPKLLISIMVLATAATMAWIYLRKPPAHGSPRYPFAGHRPWRKIGAALCLLIAVMFVLGIYVVDIPDRPVPYAIYWIIMLGLVVWLFVLALRDIMYTRGLVRQWRAEMRNRSAAETVNRSTIDDGNLQA